jgi:hypothetical protein
LEIRRDLTLGVVLGAGRQILDEEMTV